MPGSAGCPAPPTESRYGIIHAGEGPAAAAAGPSSLLAERNVRAPSHVPRSTPGRGFSAARSGRTHRLAWSLGLLSSAPDQVRRRRSPREPTSVLGLRGGFGKVLSAALGC